jgi:CBS-domain-containing membrane protein
LFSSNSSHYWLCRWQQHYSFWGYLSCAAFIPPSAAVVLIVVLGEIGHYSNAFSPAMIDSVLRIISGAIYSNVTCKTTQIGKKVKKESKFLKLKI